MVNYLLILFTLMTNIALASSLDKTQDVANPLDLLSNSAPENCNDMSDTEQEDDEETIDFTRSVDAASNEPLNVALSKKRQLENPEDNINPLKKAKKSQKKYKCTYINCDFTTNALNVFELHICRHTGEKRFKCTHEGCNYSTDKSASISIHLRTHTGEKPFKCDWQDCDFAATRKQNLNAHIMRKHIGEKPCKCDWEGCSYATAQKTKLKAHIQLKHLCLRPFKCPIEGCSYAAAEKAWLKKHINSKIHKKPTANSAVINLLINAGKNKTKGNQ